MDFSREDIKNVFCTGSHAFRVDWQLVEDLYFLLQEKLLLLKTEILPVYSQYQSYIEDIQNKKIPIIDIEGGQAAHMALKLIARNYLNSKNFKIVKFEYSFEGYVPDVITGDKSVIVECGKTNMDKVFNYFKNKSIRQLIVIPYPNSDDHNIYAYTFEPGEDLSEFLIFKQQEEAKKLKKFKSR